MPDSVSHGGSVSGSSSWVVFDTCDEWREFIGRYMFLFLLETSGMKFDDLDFQIWKVMSFSKETELRPKDVGQSWNRAGPTSGSLPSNVEK